MNSAAGPIVPVYRHTNELGNSLNWGIVNDTPNAFVWEIGHTSPYSSPGVEVLPARVDPICDSYNEQSWLGFSPLRILSVGFGDKLDEAPDGLGGRE